MFTAKAGQQVRFRVVNADGHGRNNVFNLHGHFWQEEPFANGSPVIGNNPLSEYKGAHMGLDGAVGARRITGDYLYRTQVSIMFDGGILGIFRVTP